MNLRSREAPPTMAVPMLDSEIVRQIRALTALGWGAKRIAGAVGASRNAVRRYGNASRSPVLTASRDHVLVAG